MESKERTPSVIARLMGLDDKPPQESTRKPRRVLSDRYLQKVASLGARERRSSNVHCSFKMGILEEHKIQDAIESLEALQKYMHRDQPVDRREANTTFFRSQMASTGKNSVDSMRFSKSAQLCVLEGNRKKSEFLYAKSFNKLQRVVPNSVSGIIKDLTTSRANRFRKSRKTLHQGTVELLPPEFEDGPVSKSGRDRGHELPRSCLDAMDDPCLTHTTIVDGNSKAENPARCSCSSVSSENSHSVDQKAGENRDFGSRNLFVNIDEKRKLVEDIASVGKMSKGSMEVTVDVSVKESQPLMHPVFSDSEKVYKSWSSCPDGIHVGREAKKRISERWNTISKFQEVDVIRKGKTGSEVLAMPDCEIKPRKMDYKISNRYLSNQSCRHDGSLGRIFPANDDDSSSQVRDSSIQQEDTSDGIPEEGSVSSQSSGTDQRSFVSSEEVYQRSPDSVLEMSSSAGCFERVKADLYGLKMQLELLESDSSEEYSEGPGIIASSEEGSIGCYEENQILTRSFNVEESRDFSYLVNVLTEAGLWGTNLNNSLDIPISAPVLFETLEKKYGKQMSWTRSERKLLFDRIISGVNEFLSLCMGTPTWAKPVSDRVSLSTIEERLWKTLVKRGKEASAASFKRVIAGCDQGLVGDRRAKMLERRASYEKAIRGDGWLSELGEDVEGIGEEIERSLVEEVVAEFVMSLLSF